ncbi:MAG: hypothetical protein AMXMBFR64_52890 [Myxococcales bacterium]
MLAAQVRKVSSKVAGPLRFRELDGQVLVTNDAGDWTWLDGDSFRRLVEGTLAPSDVAWSELSSRGFLRDGLDQDALARRLRSRRPWLRTGPSRHVVAVTRRTALPQAAEFAVSAEDMRPETAERACDTAFMTTSTTLDLDIVGGEPLLALPVVRHVLDYARRKNKLSLKELRLSVSTGLSALDQDAAALLVDAGVEVRACVDGPAQLSEAERSAALRQVESLAPRLAVRGVITLGARNVASAGALLADHVRAGCHTVQLLRCTPLDTALWGGSPAPLDAWLGAWERAVMSLVEAGRGGETVVEVTAATLLRRILGLDDGPGAEPRSPGPDGLGQLAYDVDGRVYSSEGGRLTGLLGDDTFLLGTVDRAGYHDLVSHPTVRALALASTLDGQPGWVDQAYAPFCGSSAVENLWDQGSIHGRMGDSTHAQAQIRMLDVLFRLVRDADPATRQVLDRWAHAAA